VQKEEAVSRVRAEVGSPLFEQVAGGAEDPLAGRWWKRTGIVTVGLNLGKHRPIRVKCV